MEDGPLDVACAGPQLVVSFFSLSEIILAIS